MGGLLGFLGRASAGIGHGLLAAGGAAANSLMPTAGMEGVLTPEQLSQSRRQGLLSMGLDMLQNSGPTTGVAPGLGQIVAHGAVAAREGYGGSMQSILGAQQMAAAQQQAQVAKQQQAQALGARQDVQTFLQPQPNDTRESFDSRVRQAQAYLVSHGDLEGAKGLMELVQTSKGPEPKSLMHVDAGDRIELRDPQTGALVGTTKKGIVPKDPNVASAPNDHWNATERNKILDDYARDTKKYDDVMSGWEVLKGATAEPSLATPFAVADAYARITNPGALVRPTTLEMIEQMGSMSQRFKKWYAHNKDGAMPPEILADFKRTLGAMVREHEKHYTDTRRATLERARQAGVSNLAPLLTTYDLSDIPQPGSPAPVSSAGPSQGLLANGTNQSNPLLR